MYKVYILECSDGSFYTGITDNLRQRLEKHASGQGSKYVRSRIPFKLVYSEDSENRSTAQKREHAIRKLSREQKQELIEQSSGVK